MFSKASSTGARTHTHTKTSWKFHTEASARLPAVYLPQPPQRPEGGLQTMFFLLSKLQKKKTHLGQLIPAQVPEHGHFWGIKVSSLIASLDFSASGAVPEQTLEEGGQQAAGQLCGCLGTPESKNFD